MVALSQFIEDSVDVNFNTSLPSTRRAEILFGLRENVSDLCQFCYEYLCRLLNEIMAVPGIGNI